MACMMSGIHPDPSGLKSFLKFLRVSVETKSGIRLVSLIYP